MTLEQEIEKLRSLNESLILSNNSLIEQRDRLNEKNDSLEQENERLNDHISRDHNNLLIAQAELDFRQLKIKERDELIKKFFPFMEFIVVKHDSLNQAKPVLEKAKKLVGGDAN